MANTSSAKKQARESAKRAVRNRSVRSAVKTRVARTRRAVVEGAGDDIREIALAAIASLDRAASKGVLHRNNSARRKSRLMKQLAQVQPASAAGETKGTRGKGRAASRGSAGAPPAKTASKTSKKG